ncbi:MAG TPA: tetratricopeptide repeat protein [Xanthomonadales bacterium]|nr:tetratricopeptide repeat protein [Xanthomonadales bacterium]
MTPSGEARQRAAQAQALHRQRRFRDAATAYRDAATLAPDWDDVWLNLALCELESGDAPTALEAVRRATELAPGREVAWELRARAAIAAHSPDEAIEASQRLAALAPDKPEYLHRLASSLRNRHRFREARDAFDELAQLDPHYLPARWEAMQSIPFVLRHAAEADALVADYEARLAEFERLPLDDERARFFLSDLVQGSTNFGLHCLGHSLPALQRRYARVVQRFAHAWQAPPQRATRPAGPRLRVGFVSPSLHHHTVGRLFRAFPLGLPRERFETFVFDLGGADDEAIATLRSGVEHFAAEPGDVHAALSRIADAALDALVFVDVGMDWRMQFLASYRLAPVQYACWGHPVTTGSDTIDAFLSGDAMEPPDGERHYTERLVRLPNLGVCYAPPKTHLLPRPRERADSIVRYFCPQAVFKLLPLHDALFARVLAGVPRAHLTLLPHPSSALCDALAARMRPSFAALGVDFDARVTLRPHLPEAEYFAELARTDVMLDTHGWSGGMTSIDGLGAGIPVVTLPGETLRGRQTYGALRVLGLEAQAARDAEDWIARAVALGVDPGARDAAATALRENAGRLHHDRAPVEALGTELLRGLA